MLWRTRTVARRSRILVTLRTASGLVVHNNRHPEQTSWRISRRSLPLSRYLLVRCRNGCPDRDITHSWTCPLMGPSPVTLATYEASAGAVVSGFGPGPVSSAQMPAALATHPYQQYPGEPSPPYSTAGPSAFDGANETFEIPPPKRQRLSPAAEVTVPDGERRNSFSISPSRPGTAAGTPGPLPGTDPKPTTPGPEKAHSRRPSTAAIASSSTKSKRVRTGCLTCRERHLKCDEGLPDCMNCRKSNRECKRGVRLNFIDVTVKDPPVLADITAATCTFLVIRPLLVLLGQGWRLLWEPC